MIEAEMEKIEMAVRVFEVAEKDLYGHNREFLYRVGKRLVKEGVGALVAKYPDVVSEMSQKYQDLLRGDLQS